MGVIVNIYVIPRRQDPADLRAPQVAARLVRERLVSPPCVVGPAFEASRDWPVSPQSATAPYLTWSDDYRLRSQLYTELPQAFPHVGRSGEAQIIAFTRLDTTNPAICEDFPNYSGPECALGLYVAPRGARLELVTEDVVEDRLEPRTVFDATLFEWLHLQGKAAPWLDVYRASRLHRAVTAVWPDVEVIENDWL
jgi:hypothetical protein